MTIMKWSETIHTQRKKKGSRKKKEQATKKKSKRIAVGLVAFIPQTTDVVYHTSLLNVLNVHSIYFKTYK